MTKKAKPIQSLMLLWYVTKKLIKNIKSHCDSLSETEPKLDQNPNPKYYHLAEWKLAIKN